MLHLSQRIYRLMHRQHARLQLLQFTPTGCNRSINFKRYHTQGLYIMCIVM